MCSQDHLCIHVSLQKYYQLHSVVLTDCLTAIIFTVGLLLWVLKHTQSLGYLHVVWTDLVSLSSGLEAQMVETRKEKIRWEGASEGKTDRVLGVDKRDKGKEIKKKNNERERCKQPEKWLAELGFIYFLILFLCLYCRSYCTPFKLQSSRRKLYGATTDWLHPVVGFWRGYLGCTLCTLALYGSNSDKLHCLGFSLHKGS